MKAILFFKRTDLALQLTGLLPLIFALLDTEKGGILFSYSSVGMMQVVGHILHLVTYPRDLAHRHRLFYTYTLLAITIIWIAGGVIDKPDFTNVALYGIMIISPFIAVWYWWLCYKETHLIKGLCNREQYTRI